MNRRTVTIGLVVLVQFAVPAALLVGRADGSRPEPFGWQMYSGRGDRWWAEVERHDGTTEAVDVDALLVRPRVELDLADALVDHLCSTIDGADVVHLAHGPQRSERRCP